MGGPNLKRYAENELRAVAGDRDLDTSTLIKTVALEDMSGYCNADTAYVYEFDFVKPFMDRYTHCIGVCLRKYAHPGLMMKMALTDEGLSRRDDHLKTLLNSVRYGDKVPTEGLKAEKHYSANQEARVNNYPMILFDNDIMLNVPSKFGVIAMPELITLTINPDYEPKYGYIYRNIGWPYKFGVESDKKDCAILYSSVTSLIVSLPNIVEDEIQAYRSDSDIDVTEYMATITDVDMSKYANADTVLIYDLELDKPYLEKYSYCMGIYLRKYGHLAMLVKVLMDNEGLKHKDSYLRTALNSIRYGDTPTKDGLEGEEKYAIPTKFPLPRTIWVKPKEGYIN